MSTTAANLVTVDALTKVYDTRRGLIARALKRSDYLVQALNGVSFRIARGETLGLIGESGCGKSTLARVLVRLEAPSSGHIVFDGTDITALAPRELTALRSRLQIIFQDPYASLNPRHTVERIVGLPLRIHRDRDRGAARDEVVAMLERVGLKALHLNRFPHQFSGGQRQRIGIARALIVRPEVVVCDEPVSALDVSIQAQILHLLLALKRDFSLTFLFIGHNLSVVGYVSDRIAVMYLGEIVEIGPARDILTAPRHPYTQSLIAAVPSLSPRSDRAALRARGEPGSPLRPPPGCRFHPRCARAMPQCASHAPQLRETAPGSSVACHLFDSPKETA